MRKNKYENYLKKNIISGDDNFTDNGLKYILNILKMNLYCNIIITDEGLKYITNVLELDLRDNINIITHIE